MGKCLSESYDPYYLKFRCKRNHEFILISKTIFNGSWCQECINIDKLYDIQTLAAANNCVCLSDKYVSSMDKFEWCCHMGHVWITRIDYVKINWCIKCKKNKEHLQKSNELVNRVFNILNKTTFIYPNIDDEQWKNLTRKSNIYLTCSKNHSIPVKIMNLINNESYICLKCRGGGKNTIDEAKEIAKQRNGECLSDIYINNISKLLWKCNNNHEWAATFSSIKNSNSWCPECNINVDEEISRHIFNTMFDTKFIKVRPNWLDSLELDGYNEHLNLGFEYNGIQHYKFSKLYHKSSKDFESQQERDKRKVNLCIKNNVILIIIPYTIKSIDIQQFIIDQCKYKNIKIPFPKILDINTFKHIYSPKNQQMLKIEEKVNEKNGRIIEENCSYIHSNYKFEVECNIGHRWKTSWSALKQNKWCPKCSRRNPKHTIEEMKEIAKKNNGLCLSTEYIACNKKLLWKCNICLKQWEAVPNSIMHGHWYGNINTCNIKIINCD